MGLDAADMPPSYEITKYPFWMQSVAEQRAWDGVVVRYQKYCPLITIMQMHSEMLANSIKASCFTSEMANRAEQTFQIY